MVKGKGATGINSRHNHLSAPRWHWILCGSCCYGPGPRLIPPRPATRAAEIEPREMSSRHGIFRFRVLILFFFLYRRRLWRARSTCPPPSRWTRSTSRSVWSSCSRTCSGRSRCPRRWPGTPSPSPWTTRTPWSHCRTWRQVFDSFSMFSAPRYMKWT